MSLLIGGTMEVFSYCEIIYDTLRVKKCSYDHVRTPRYVSFFLIILMFSLCQRYSRCGLSRMWTMCS